MKKPLYPELPILIVDDEESFLDSMKATLRVGGITNVVCCQDSRDVMPRLTKKKFSLIILDILMPYIRGDELLPEIRKKYPDLKVILLTASSRESISLNFSENFVIDYIQKPFDSQQLAAKIKEAFNERNP
jgi:DNA-binding NtrC family response regulator